MRSLKNTATPEIYTLSLHDALPISVFDAEAMYLAPGTQSVALFSQLAIDRGEGALLYDVDGDRKSTRLNSSHEWISYAVFCLKKKTGDRKYAITSALDHAGAIVKRS